MNKVKALIVEDATKRHTKINTKLKLDLLQQCDNCCSKLTTEDKQLNLCPYCYSKLV